MNWSGVEYLWIIVMLLSAVWTLFGSDVMINFSNSVPMKKQTHLEWLEREYIFIKFSFLGELFL